MYNNNIYFQNVYSNNMSKLCSVCVLYMRLCFLNLYTHRKYVQVLKNKVHVITFQPKNIVSNMDFQFPFC